MKNELLEAKNLSKHAHYGQKDKAGVDYFKGHINAVVEGLDPSSENITKEKTVAYLHDIVEDTFISIDSIRKMFSPEIAEAVEILTKDPKMDYMKYIKRIRKNPLARAVKISDLKNNSDLSRLKEVTEKDLKRTEQYKKALDILLGEE